MSPLLEGQRPYEGQKIGTPTMYAIWDAGIFESSNYELFGIETDPKSGCQSRAQEPAIRLTFRVSPELLKNTPSHHAFRCVEPKQASRDFTHQIERFDNSTIQPEMIVPLVLPGIEQRD